MPIRLRLLSRLASPILALSIATTAAYLSGPADAGPSGAVDPARFQGLRYRMVGPHRGGRVTAVAGHRRQPSTYYMGSTGGGVWKTTDYGQLWVNISDGFFETASIGAIDVAESDPGVIYVGTGSAAIRSNVITGRGVYKSTDAGRTWTHIGLRRTGAIGSLKVHPHDADVAYVAALGQIFGPNEERGVFRTTDGGRTWQKVLYINDRTGAVSLAINPSNPSEIYAGAWRGERKPWTIISGGPAAEGGIYKTTDGGDTWTKLPTGLPQTLIGKVGLDVSRANPRRVYAIIEAPGREAGVYRSDDAGATFQQTSAEPALIARPFYYTYIHADPKNPDLVWVNNLALHRSEDGGRTWTRVPTPHGDNHGMWINPDDPDLIVQSNDGGANVSRDGGRTWSTQYNQPTAELYQVEVDDQFPYRLYGAQQDNSTLIVPSLPPMAGRVDDPIQLWQQGSGCETGPIKPKPGKPAIVYGVCKGEFYRLNLETGQQKSYWVFPQNRYGHASRDIRFRFQRTSPFEISPHDPDVIYHGSHVLHRTTDEGVTWEIISPDLTANESDKQGISGEPITRDITGEEVYSAIYAIRESALERGVIWVGANDGPVHVTRDGGKTWVNVTPIGLPPGGRVQNIDASPHRRGSAYIAAYRYMLDDWEPYIYRTDDYGASWTRLTDGANGIPADFPTRVVREDPDREGLLYAGTEFGMFVSFDNGGRWQPFQLNLPVTPITDIRVHRRDLVLSTMGRSFWVLDNLTPLHQVAPTAAGTLFAPRTAYRMRSPAMGGRADQPEYPAPGAQIDYHLAADASGEVALEILDGAGRVVRSFSSRDPDTTTAELRQDMRAPVLGRAGTPRLPAARGHQRFTWDLRHAGPWDADPQRRGAGGPHAVPGRYQVRLQVNGTTYTQTLELELDPREEADGVTQADLEEQLAFNLELRDAITAARLAAARVAGAKKSASGDRLNALEAVEARLVTAGGAYPQPMLIDQLGYLFRMTSAAEQKIGRSAFVFFDELRRELDAIQADLARAGTESGARR